MDIGSLILALHDEELRRRQFDLQQRQMTTQEMDSAIGSLMNTNKMINDQRNNSRKADEDKSEFAQTMAFNREKLNKDSDLMKLLYGNQQNPAGTGLSGMPNTAPSANPNVIDTTARPVETPSLDNDQINKIKMGLISKKFGVPYKELITPEQNSEKLKNEINKKEMMSMATSLPKLDQAYQSVSQLEELYKKGASPDRDPVTARTTGVGDYIQAKLGFNPNLGSYIKNSKAFAGLIAKGGFGESGMLTNEDINRVVSSLPNPGSTQAEAKIGFDEIKSLLGAARDRYNKKLNGLTGNQSNKIGRFTIEVQ